jgi:molybdopterin synthase catalytic subunit
LIEITTKAVSAQLLIDAVRKDGHGAVVSFVGVVRDNAEGKRVLYLEYEAYAEMAIKKIQEICTEAENRWGTNVSVVHRVGRLEIGDTAVVITVGASHRREAFLACQYTIDRIKEIVPIWKKEFYDDTSTWVGHLPRTT